MATQLLTEIYNWELKYIFVFLINGEVTFTNFWTINQNVTSGEAVLNVIPYCRNITWMFNKVTIVYMRSVIKLAA